MRCLRYVWYATASATLALVALLGQAAPASADNCSGLQDCYGSAQSAASAVAGITVLLGASVLLAPRLLHRDTPAADHKKETPLVPVAERPGAKESGKEPGKEHGEEHRREGVEGVETPELARPLHYDEKIRADMATREWSAAAVEGAVQHPAWTASGRDTRYNQDGSRDDAPAIVFGKTDRSYVVVNTWTWDVVHVSTEPVSPRSPDWVDPALLRRALAHQIALETAPGTVLTDGREFFYPVAEGRRVVGYCALRRIRVLGMEGFVRGPSGGLSVQPDLILDCSAERNAEEAGESDPAAAAAEAAHRAVAAWRGTPDLFVTFTVTI
jgi:hypothetical protein